MSHMYGIRDQAFPSRCSQSETTTNTVMNGTNHPIMNTNTTIPPKEGRVPRVPNPKNSTTPTVSSPLEPSLQNKPPHHHPLVSEAAENHHGDRLDQKIARLPKATRDMLNLMLDDGLPYHIIIEELGETVQGLGVPNLTKWVQGGYEEYIKQRQTIEGAKTQAEFAADLLRELGEIDPSVIHRACMRIASVQIFNAIREYGDEALREMLQSKPASYLNLINTLCKTVQPTLDLENHRLAMAGVKGDKS